MLHNEAAAGLLPGVWSWPLDRRSCHPSFQKAVLKMETQLRARWCRGGGQFVGSGCGASVLPAAVGMQGRENKTWLVASERPPRSVSPLEF